MSHIRRLESKNLGVMSASRFVVQPGGETSWDLHSETELWIVIDGAGTLVADGRRTPISAGDLIHFPPFRGHRLINDSDRDLTMVNVWLEHDASVQAALRAPQPESERQGVVLPSFTTPNGRMHVGHLAGPVVAADAFTRAQALAGCEEWQLCGTIGYQTHVENSARQEGKSYLETALFYSQDFAANYRLLNIEPSVFATLSEAELFHEVASDFVVHLNEAGHLFAKTENVPFCRNTERFLFEAQVSGKCPHCGSVISSECETCALFVPDDELVDPVCHCCQAPADRAPLERLYVALEPHRAVLLGLLESAAYVGISDAFVRKVLASPLPDIPLSIIAPSGIDLPIPGYPGHKLYSAVELAPRFLTALALKLRAGAKEPEAGYSLTLFFGSDNLYLRCITFPILLALVDADKFAFSSFLCNEFFQLDHAKFSTSRRNVLYAEDITGDGPLTPDLLRWFLAHERPETRETNFDLAEAQAFAARVTASLAEVTCRTVALVQRHTGGKAPEAGRWDRVDMRFRRRLDALVDDLERDYARQAFDLRSAARSLLSLLDALREFAEYGAVTAADPAALRTRTALLLLGLKSFAILVSPLAPRLSRTLLAQLGIASESLTFAAARTWITSGTPIDLPLEAKE